MTAAEDAAAYVPLDRRPYHAHERLVALAGTPRRVLDVGCSSGYLARELVAKGATVVGVELDPRAAEVAREVCEQVVVGDVETVELPFDDGSFDLVLCGDVLEHLRDPPTFLRRVRPLLAQGGRLVLTTPNVANWAMRLSLLAGRWRYGDRGILDRTHTHLFTQRTLEETLEWAGYRILELDVTAPLPVGSTPRADRIAHAIARLRPSLLAYQFVVAATPRR